MEVGLNSGTHSSLEAAPHVVHKVNERTRHTPPVEGTDVYLGNNDDWLRPKSYLNTVAIIAFNYSRIMTLTDELTMSL